MVAYIPGSRPPVSPTCSGYSSAQVHTALIMLSEYPKALNPSGNTEASCEPSGKIGRPRLRGTEMSVVAPECVSMEAMSMVSGRVPSRPSPVSLPMRKTLMRGVSAHSSSLSTTAAPVLPNTFATVSLCTRA